MKRYLLLLLLPLFTLCANADDPVEIDGIYYNLISKAKLAEVTTNPNKYSGDVVIPETVTYGGEEYSVISISYSAFCYCSGLTSITIPNSVTSIGEDAFRDCSGLTSVHILDIEAWCNISFNGYNSNPLSFANHLYLNGEEIKDLVIPNRVTSIGDRTFSGCSGLTSVTIPNSVTSIGKRAFEGCSGLTSVTIPNSVTSIGERAFWGCSSLTSVTIPNSVTSISERVFVSCIGLISVTIPNSVTSIGVHAFEGCYGLTSVTIPNSVTYIGSGAFSGCNGLNSITIGSGVIRIDLFAFAECPELTDVYCYAEKVPDTYSSDPFEGSYIKYATLHVPKGSVDAYKAVEPWKNFKEIIEMEDPSIRTVNVAAAGTLSQLISNDEKFKITDLTITGQLNGTDFRLIREMAGSDYQGHATNGKLMKLDLSGARIVAGGDVYYNNYGLWDENGNQTIGFGSHSVTTKDNVIGECLFAGCSKLEEIKIPENIIEIGEHAFMCTNISAFDIPEAVEKVDLSFFWGSKVSTLYIPQNVSTLTASDGFMGNQSTLTLITVDANNTKYDSRNDCNAIIEKESKTLILGCKNTAIPDGVVSIGKYAFGTCSGLTSITIPTSVTSLQEGAFMSTGLTSISLPSSLRRIEQYALYGTKIPTITIPASVEYIGLSALRACSKLTQIAVEASNTTYDSRDNCNAIIETATNTLIQGCNKATIPASVTAIGIEAFRNCNDLTSITIPATVSSIANLAFYNCDNLISISVEAETPPVISEYTFSNRANTTLYVPAGCKAAYEADDGWKGFKEIVEKEVTKITLNKTNAIIEKGKSKTLKATVYPSDLEDKSVTWTSSDTKIATVSSSGKVKGVKTGTATITCTYVATGATATCEVIVGSIKIDQTEIVLEKGKTQTLKGTVYPSTLEDKSVTWTSSDTKIATVSSSGEVKGVKTGTAFITCTSNATGLKAICEVTVGSIKIDQTEIVLEKGKTQTLKATVYPSTLEDKSVTWTSSDTKIATVSSSGKVKGVKTGTATITCTSNATGLSATCEVIVGTIKIDKAEIVLEKGNTLTLKSTVYPSTLEDKSVTWTSSDTKIATVSSSGKVKGVKTGTATITCTSNATGLSATCEVIVGTIKIDKAEIVLEKGNTQILKATVYPTTLEDKSVTWTSSDKSVATVSSSGKVKGIAPGTATITCTSNATGLSATCTVTVVAAAGTRTYEGGIDEMDKASEAEEPFDVYDMSGRKVRHQVTSLDGLPKGIYIVKGKKVMKK